MYEVNHTRSLATETLELFEKTQSGDTPMLELAAMVLVSRYGWGCTDKALRGVHERSKKGRKDETCEVFEGEEPIGTLGSRLT